MIRVLRNSLVVFAALLVTAVVSILTSLPLHAQEMGEMNVHFSAEVAIPDHLLPPGDYLIRRVSANNPNIFEISGDGGRTFVGFIHVVPKLRTDTRDTEVELSAPDAAGVSMVRAWYANGGPDGYQILYSGKDMRRLDELARAENRSGSVGQP